MTDETIWVLDDCEYLSGGYLDKHRGEIADAFGKHVDEGKPLSEHEKVVIAKFVEIRLIDVLDNYYLSPCPLAPSDQEVLISFILEAIHWREHKSRSRRNNKCQ